MTLSVTTIRCRINIYNLYGLYRFEGNGRFIENGQNRRNSFVAVLIDQYQTMPDH